MSEIDLKACQLLVEGADSKAGLGWLEWYNPHKVFHPGIDINKGYGDQDLGVEIMCPCDGIVEYVSPVGKNGGFGLHAVIYHSTKNLWTHYVHLSSFLLKQGDCAKKHNVIAHLGKSGTTYAHLHFEVWKQILHDTYQVKRVWYDDYCFYPKNWRKSKVFEHYYDPNQFLRECMNITEPNWINSDKFVIPKWEGLREAINWNKALDKPIISEINSEQKCREVLMFHRYFLNFK